MKEKNSGSNCPRRVAFDERWVSSNCPTCGRKFDRLVLSVCGEEVFQQRPCGNCLAKREKESLAIENKNRRVALDERWASFCPRRFQASDSKNLALDQQLIDRVMRWRPSNEGRGIGLVGQPRIGKLELLYLLAKDLFYAGTRLAQIAAIDFERLVTSGQYNNELQTHAFQRMSQIRRAHVLIFSNLGMEKLTDRPSRALFANRISRTAPPSHSVDYAVQRRGDRG